MRSNRITLLLHELKDGKSDALEELMPIVYSELRRQAAGLLKRENPGHTLQTSDLIHETYLKLIDQRRTDWVGRNHFFAVSATLMRRILVDHARKRRRARHGGGLAKTSLEDVTLVSDQGNTVDLLALDDALDRLAKLDSQQARIIELRYFSGLSLEETAAAMGISRSSVASNWAMARAWLHRELKR